MVFSLEKCSDPSGNTNARVIGNKFYHGEEVEFVCPRDHILVPSRSSKLTCNDGTWGGPIPLCKGEMTWKNYWSIASLQSRDSSHAIFVFAIAIS